MEQGLNRRRFLGAAVGTGAAAGLGALAPSALARKGRGRGPRHDRGRGPEGKVHPHDISIQLYTLRHIIDNDRARARQVFRALSRIGYRKVELAGRYGWSASELRRELDRAGLWAHSSHDDPRAADYDATLAGMQELGQQYTGLAWIPGPYTTERFKALAQQLNEAGEKTAAAGIQFFYHNHDFEFSNKQADGTPLYNILLEETDPELVKFELDLYWIVVGGENPLAYLSADPERYPLYHVKDKTWKDRPDAQDWEDVGPGAIDFPDIFEAGESRRVRKQYIVEHDDPNLSHPDNPDDAGLITAGIGYDYLRDVRF